MGALRIHRHVQPASQLLQKLWGLHMWYMCICVHVHGYTWVTKVQLHMHAAEADRPVKPAASIREHGDKLLRGLATLLWEGSSGFCASALWGFPSPCMRDEPGSNYGILQ